MNEEIDTIPPLVVIEEDKKDPRRKNDALLKGAVEDFFPYVLRFFYHNADDIFDMAKGFEWMNTELHEIQPQLSQKGGSRAADLLVKVHLINGNTELFLLHLEIQKVTNNEFSKRVFEYWYRLTDKYKSAVVSLAVFTGIKTQLQPDQYSFNLLGTELNFKYNTYQIFNHTEEELIEMDNPFALAVIVAQQEALSKKLKDADRQTTRMKIMKALKANSKLNPVQIKEFVLFLNRIIIVKDSKYNIIFDKQVQDITGGAITMGITETLKMLDREEGIEIGIERGIEQGIEQERAHKNFEFVARLLEKAGWSDEQTADVANVSVAYVNEVRNELASRK